MQKGKHRDCERGQVLSNQSPRNRRRKRLPLVCRRKPKPISNTGASTTEHQELAYDYYLQLAEMWDDPEQSFDLNLTK
jgi:hypothetical protein